MKKFFCIILISTLVACLATNKTARTNYEVVPDSKTKVLRGVINRSVLEKDTSFAWFKENMKWGQADETAVEAFRTKATRFKLVVFGGTWCPDTQNLWPVFYRLIDKSGYPEKNITLIAVDRKKETIHHLNQTYHITNVPTFIVLKNGREVGRVVEYGKYNAIDKELGEIVKSIQ
jgi:thiol-disulfide isomerase/thioredoxin